MLGVWAGEGVSPCPQEGNTVGIQTDRRMDGDSSAEQCSGAQHPGVFVAYFWSLSSSLIPALLLKSSPDGIWGEQSLIPSVQCERGYVVHFSPCSSQAPELEKQPALTRKNLRSGLAAVSAVC